jgi:hypothetical protein
MPGLVQAAFARFHLSTTFRLKPLAKPKIGFTKFSDQCFQCKPSDIIFAWMKKFLLILPFIFFAVTTFAQNALSKGYLEAYFNSTGMVSYREYGEITKDGIMLIDLKTSALNNFISKSNPDAAQMDSIQKEKLNLETLRQRILVQRERMIKPLPPLQEMQ